jgi:MATE family multidrug resistance protein
MYKLCAMNQSQRYRTILLLALPIIGGQISQNLLNIVDLAMVGQLGSVAVAAVGVASFSNFLAASFVMGLGSGVQALVSRRIGEGKPEAAVRALNGGLFLALAIGLPISIGLFLVSELLMTALTSDAAVAADATSYFSARVLGSFAIGMNFAFRGYWNGVSLSMIYMRTLIIMHLANIALNYLLIFGKFGFPELGVAGAGAGTALSIILGVVLYSFQASPKPEDMVSVANYQNRLISFGCFVFRCLPVSRCFSLRLALL